jgi:cytochrome d ubiquinol oxidase subunit I
MGRQPWTVFGVLKTSQSVSPGVTASSVIISMTVFTLLYAGLAATAGWLMFRHVRDGAPAEPDPSAADAGDSRPVFSY